VLNGVTFAIVQGTQAVLNTILVVGGTIVETIQTSVKLLIDYLNDVGTQTQQFFQVTKPIVNVTD